MPKYYVESGDLREVVSADHPLQAFKVAINRHPYGIMGAVNCMFSEQSFYTDRSVRKIYTDDIVLPTIKLIIALDLNYEDYGDNNKGDE